MGYSDDNRERLTRTLEALVRLVEQQSDGMLASVLLLAPDGTLRHGAAPSLPDVYNRAIDGVAIGEGVGSCGTAAFRAKQVIVTDIQTDPLWKDFRELASSHDLRACWSTPIFGSDGAVLGTFALYYRRPCDPTPAEIELTNWAAQLAAAAIEGQRTELALRHSEQSLKEIFERAPAVIATLRGPEHVYEIANHRYVEAIGGRDIVGKPIREALPELAGQGIFELLDEVYRTGRPHIEAELGVQLNRGPGGSAEEAFFNFVYEPLRDADGEITGILVHAVEVTAQVMNRRRVEQQAKELEAANAELQRVNAEIGASEEQFRTLAESIPQLAWMADADGFIFWYNQRWYDYTGTTPSQMEGWGWQSVHDPDILPQVLERWRLSLDTHQPFDMEFPLRGADGVFRWFLTRVSPVKDADGRVVRWFGTNTNVDEQRRAFDERDRALSEAEEARQVAEIANQAKSAFLATMSHELRTPINAIVGYTELLDLGIGGPLNDGQRTHLQRIRFSSQHLLSLINDVLDLAKIESGQMEVSRKPVRVADVVQQAAAIVFAQAAARRIELVEQAEDARNQFVLGDEDRIRQILTNLLGNAIKFTHPGGRVVISASNAGSPASASATAGDPAERWIRLDVQDTGIGVPADRLEAIFEPFVQVDSQLTRVQEGTGLGLTISRNLARMMGGDLSAESRVGEGSTFTVWLPEAEATADAKVPADGRGGPRLPQHQG